MQLAAPHSSTTYHMSGWDCRTPCSNFMATASGCGCGEEICEDAYWTGAKYAGAPTRNITVLSPYRTGHCYIIVGCRCTRRFKDNYGFPAIGNGQSSRAINYVQSHSAGVQMPLPLARPPPLSFQLSFQLSFPLSPPMIQYHLITIHQSPHLISLAFRHHSLLPLTFPI